MKWKPAALIAFLLVLAGFCLLPAGVQLLNKLWWGQDPPKEINYSQGWVQAVTAPLMITGFFVAAVLWGQSNELYKETASWPAAMGNFWLRPGVTGHFHSL